MKEILFRGKHKDSGEWEYGYLFVGKSWLDDSPIVGIISEGEEVYAASLDISYDRVDPETVGRLLSHPCYDGRYAEHRFFEGDIIEVWRNRRADVETDKPDTIAIVVDESCITESGSGRWFPQDTTQVRVIGNVHDNPELVGKKYADLYKYYYGFMTTVTREDLKRNLED